MRNQAKFINAALAGRSDNFSNQRKIKQDGVFSSCARSPFFCLPASPMSAPSSSSSSFSSVSTAVTASLLQTSHLTPKVAKQVIRSFSLLGINEYLYSLKKTDVHHAMNSLNTPTSINASSFDKTNERTLLVLLHFLLAPILSPEFKTEVSNPK